MAALTPRVAGSAAGPEPCTAPYWAHFFLVALPLQSILDAPPSMAGFPGSLGPTEWGTGPLHRRKPWRGPLSFRKHF